VTHDTPQSTRTTLRRLRATLAAWGATAVELAWLDAWGAAATWATGAAREVVASEEVYTNLDTARAAALDVMQRMETAAVGLSFEERRGAWAFAHGGYELVAAALERRSQRERPSATPPRTSTPAAPAAASTSAPKPTTPKPETRTAGGPQR